MRIAVPFLALALAVPSATTARPAAAPIRTVPCDEIILPARAPRAGGHRVVLGALSVPPAYIPQTVPTGDRPWA
jgi:hypothetical protein